MRLNSYTAKVFWLIIVFSFLRIVTASVMELGNDESYYWLYSKHLQWNYFDHPPMIALWLQLFTANGLLAGYEGFLRLGSVVSCGCSTYFLYKAVCVIKDKRTGLIAACLFNASLYAGLLAGVLVMPDSPQLFFWTFCLWQLAKLASGNNEWSTWILFGVSAGLCNMSKIHGVFIWIGFTLFIINSRRMWLRNSRLYVAALISLVITSPVLLWNVQYDFVTWKFHSARIVPIESLRGAGNFFSVLPEQIFITNPFVFFCIAAVVFTFKKQKSLHPALIAYNWIAFPLIILLLVISLFREVWFHWSGPAYCTLIPLAAIRLSDIHPKQNFPRIVTWATCFSLLVMIAWPLTIRFFPGSIGSKEQAQLGNGDVTLDKLGWKESGQRFASAYAHRINASGSPVICTSWWGAHIEYYFARPANATVIGIGDVYQLHQYGWLNEKRLSYLDMDTAYCILPSQEGASIDSTYLKFYRQHDLVETIPVYRRNKHVSNFFIYRLSMWTGREPLVMRPSEKVNNDLLFFPLSLTRDIGRILH